MGKILDRLLWAQSDLQAKALQSSHPDAGGTYHATVRLSLEPDRHFLGLSRRWRFPEMAVGAACCNVRFQLFRTVTFDTKRSVRFPRSRRSTSALRVRIQAVDATHALNRSAGVSKSRVFLGRSFSLRATALSFTCECTDKSVPLGKYCRNKPLVFSFDPRCQGFWGSQK